MLKFHGKLSSSLMALFFLVVANVVHGQTIEEASDYFKRREWDSAFVIAKNIIRKDKTIADAYVIAGRCLVAKNNYHEAIEYLEKGKSLSNAPAYSKAWALRELGLCYFSKGEYAKAKEDLLGCLELNATKNVNKAAQNSLFKLGLDKFYDTWIIKKTQHFIFHFQDTSTIVNVSMFIHRKEAAFDTINNFFKSKLPKKIDYFVWSSSASAESLLKHPLAYTDPTLCLTHTEPKHTVGHELTHSISYYCTTTVNPNQLITEGVCVYFDLSNRNNISLLKERNDSIISVIDIWKKNLQLSDEIIYPLGGELVKRLIAEFGREKLIDLLADQSYENAKKIYGEKLDVLLIKLQDEINQ